MRPPTWPGAIWGRPSSWAAGRGDGAARGARFDVRQLSRMVGEVRSGTLTIEGVSGAIAQISTASHEQTTGIDRASKAIGEIGRTTRQDAVLVKEAAAAAASLSQHTQHVTTLVSAFYL